MPELRETPRVPGGGDAGRLLNKFKALRRADTIVTGYRRLNGALNAPDKVLSLCSYQDGSENSEPVQFERELGPHTYIGVDTNEAAIDHNEALLPDLTWYHGTAVAAAQDFPDAKLVNLDFCGLHDVFFKGNLQERFFTGSKWADPWPLTEVVDKIQYTPGTLPCVLDRINDDAVVFVNVCTRSKRGDFGADLPVFLKALGKVYDWKLASVLSGASRNLAIPTRGPKAKFYTYKSNVRDYDPTAKGSTYEYTTFCLVNR